MAQVLSVNVYIRTSVMASLADSRILAFRMFVTKTQHVCLMEVLVWDPDLVLDQDQDQGCLDQVLDQQHLTDQQCLINQRVLDQQCQVLGQVHQGQRSQVLEVAQPLVQGM